MGFAWAEDAEPLELSWEDGHTQVAISWADGHTSRYNVNYLRRICPCAICRDAHATPPISTAPKKPFQILNDSQVKLAKSSFTVRQAYPIGHYALGFTWDDGHDDGIYSWQLLRGMCPCLECAARVKADAPPDSEASDAREAGEAAGDDGAETATS